MNKRYLRAKELAERWGISLRTVYDMKDKGKIPWMPLGKAVRFPLDKIEKYEEEYEQTNTATPAHQHNEKVLA